MEAVEAKCGGCERSPESRWSWHGGGEGTAGVSSQEELVFTAREDRTRRTFLALL